MCNYTMKKIIIPIGLAALMLGCTSIWHGGAPRPAFNIQKDIRELTKQYAGVGSVANYSLEEKAADNDPTKLKTARNKYLTARLVLIDLEYVVFVRSITRDRQLLDSSSDILIMSLNLAGAGTASAAAKTILHSLSAGITGSKITLDRDFFYEKTVPALVAAMNAERAKARINLLEGMKRESDEYPFHQGVIDTQLYYEAGTFLGAISGIQESASVSETASKIKIEEIKDKSQGHYDILRAITTRIPKLQPADLDAAWTALEPVLQDKQMFDGGTATKIGAGLTKPADISGFMNIYKMVFPGMKSKGKEQFYANLVKAGIISESK